MRYVSRYSRRVGDKIIKISWTRFCSKQKFESREA